jgi:hypothetical protein
LSLACRIALSRRPGANQLWVLVRGSGQSRGEIKGPSCPYRPRGDPTTDRDDGPGRDRQAARCCAQHRLSVARAGRMTGIGARRILGAANPPIRLYCWSRDLSRWPSASSPCWAAGAHNAQPCRPLLHHMLPHGFSHRTGSTNKLLRHAQRGGLTSQSPIRAAHSEHMTTACIQAASAGPGKYPMRAATRSYVCRSISRPGIHARPGSTTLPCGPSAAIDTPARERPRVWSGETGVSRRLGRNEG